MADTSVLLPLPYFGEQVQSRLLSRYVRIALSAILLVTVGFLPSQVARAEEKTAPDACGAPVIPESPETKHINMVVDDSGSMIRDADSKQLLDRWSFAKYSVEVFAALMGPGDSLDVYLLSSFTGDGNRQASISLQGRQTQSGIDRIRSIEVEGSGTPFEAIQRTTAEDGLRPADQNWLVILTDGEFRDSGNPVPTARVQERLESFLGSQQETNRQLGVAFLALGDEAPNLAALTDQGLVFAQAQNSRDLLTTMGSFANRIFGRSNIQLATDGAWSTDLDLEEVIVFAQGADVDVASATVNGERIPPQSTVQVSWIENKAIRFPNNDLVTPRPNEGLQGQIATFGEIPRGDIGFDISNAETVELFYRPKVNFGARLTDAEGRVKEDSVVEGTHTLDFGFLSDCEFVNDSSLLSAGNFLAAVYQDGELVAEDIEPGDQVELKDGDVTIEYSATYLDGVPETDEQTFKVAKPPLPSRMTAVVPEYKVSEMAEYPPPARQIAIDYEVIEDGIPRQPLPEEWATLNPDTFQISRESNLEFELVKEETPGQLRLLVRAPEGDVYKANTGTIEEKLTGSYLPGQAESVAELDVPIEVENDLSFWDRRWHDFKTWGWKVLLALLLLAIILGYIFKRRFSKRVKRRPSITGTPWSVGVTPIEDRGKFQASGFRKFLPFVANTATLSYVPPGTIGFRAMKLKAGPRKSMIVTNWKEIAEKDNVEINGNPLNSETRRPPKLSASGTISASTPQMTYEMTPST
jgi:hypothetical protein